MKKEEARVPMVLGMRQITTLQRFEEKDTLDKNA